jgi:hypothetical protein
VTGAVIEFTDGRAELVLAPGVRVPLQPGWLLHPDDRPWFVAEADFEQVGYEPGRVLSLRSRHGGMTYDLDLTRTRIVRLEDGECRMEPM